MSRSSRTGGPRYPALASTVFITLILLCMAPAWADETFPVLPLLREQRRDAEALERQQRLRQLTPPTVIETPNETPAAALETEGCWPVSGLRLAGNTLISREALNEVVDPLLQPCMDEARVNAVLKAITRLYLQLGYLASRPYLAQPPHAGASLDILIVEGFVESVEFDDPELPLSLSRAFPDLLGQPLRLSTLEQGLNQMNRLQAFDLSADLEPGELRGGTRVIIRSQRQPASRLKLATSLDNRGSEATGRERLGVSLSLDSPLEHNDFLRLHSLRRLLPGRGDSRGYGLYYNSPYGPWRFALSLDRLEYRAALPGSNASNSGQSDFYSLGVDRAPWHDQSTTLGANLRLNYKRLDTRFSSERLRLRLQSPTLTSLDASLNLSWRDDALWNATLGYNQGLGWFGSDDRAANPRAPQPLFRKYLASLWQLREGVDPAFRWRWESELNLQYSPEPLPAIEQMAVAGDTAVRGFRRATVSGASGAVWRNTLSLPLNNPLPVPLEIRPSLGLDAGWSRYDHGSPTQRLLGAHAGLQLSLPRGQLSLDYQRALQASGTRRRDLEPGYWRAQLTLTF